MVLEQIYTKCLAQGAYYIEHNGEAAIIDPLRETEPYIERLNNNNVELKYIFETHFHADFVSGHLSLSQLTGAQIVYGPKAQPNFKFISAKDGQIFNIGGLSIEVLHTPGHTLESTCYLLKNESGENVAIFTGDTLFLGDVGRPDLAQKGNEITQEDLAGMLFNSLRTKIMPLNDNILIYPAHGAGSSCGKSMMNITVDTLGNQKKVNYALRADMTKSEFIEEVLDGLERPPAYFPLNVKLNKNGYDASSEDLVKKAPALNAEDFKQKSESKDVIILDVRHQNDFAKNHIPGSIFIGLNGGFAPWVGEIIKDVDQALLLVCPKGKETETIIRLSRVGFDNVKGFLKNGINAYIQAGYATVSLNRIEPREINLNTLKDNNQVVLDVRNSKEFSSGHLPHVLHAPLSSLELNIDLIPKNKELLIHCAGGYRSVIAASLLLHYGYKDIKDISGGFAAIKKSQNADAIMIEKTSCSF